MDARSLTGFARTAGRPWCMLLMVGQTWSQFLSAFSTRQIFRIRRIRYTRGTGIPGSALPVLKPNIIRSKLTFAFRPNLRHWYGPKPYPKADITMVRLGAVRPCIDGRHNPEGSPPPNPPPSSGRAFRVWWDDSGWPSPLPLGRGARRAGWACANGCEPGPPRFSTLNLPLPEGRGEIGQRVSFL